MIECNMPQDILKYEAKFVGNFTMRQTIWGGIGIAMALVGFFGFFKGSQDISTKIALSAVTAIPFFAMGFVKIYGQPLEKALYVIILDNLIKPAKRPYMREYPTLKKWEKHRSFQPEEQLISPYNSLLPEEEQLVRKVLTEKELKQLNKQKQFRVKRSPEYPPIY